MIRKYQRSAAGKVKVKTTGKVTELKILPSMYFKKRSFIIASPGTTSKVWFLVFQTDDRTDSVCVARTQDTEVLSKTAVRPKI